MGLALKPPLLFFFQNGIFAASTILLMRLIEPLKRLKGELLLWQRLLLLVELLLPEEFGS